MAVYLVRARPVESKLAELANRIRSGEVRQMNPFGKALERSLSEARRDESGWAVWEEVDFCQPPLAAERAAVLDAYFTNISVEPVDEDEGWDRIEHLPSLWKGNSG